MEKKTARLYFIDAMRAWAILMMLQGHFIDGLLDNAFRDPDNAVFSIWQYFRGITAPVFFTVSGFIFTYLLIKGDKVGLENPRVKKGIRRGLQLLMIGYLLRLNLWGLLVGEVYGSFYLVDVLHCIGLSILTIVGLYLLTSKKRPALFPWLLTGMTLVLFVFEPWYADASFEALPIFLANYISKANGSIFTIIPWLGYATFGSFLALVFTRFKNAKNLYPIAISTSFAVGGVLILFSSDAFLWMSEVFNIQLFEAIHLNNYLFIRLGNVFVVFGIFMLLRSFLKNATVLKVGQSTLSIYVIHFIILYGSFTGLGLYWLFDHSLSPFIAIPSALAFMFICTYSALKFERHKEYINLNVNSTLRFGFEMIKSNLYRLLRFFRVLKS